jgi:hypothetical protein
MTTTNRSKPFDECEPTERQSVGGTLGGETRKEQMAQEHGGGEEGVHKAYAEMGASGGKKGTQE